MDRDNDCESIFIEDVIEKKKTGRSAFSKTNCTRRRNGGMPSDMLRGKKLKEYMGNSEVKAYNLNDVAKVKTYNSRKKTTYEDDIEIIKMYQNGDKISAITSRYEISPPVVYSILKANGIQKKSEISKQQAECAPPETENVAMGADRIGSITQEVVGLLLQNKVSYLEVIQVLKTTKSEIQRRVLI
jgi:hypothetical protein